MASRARAGRPRQPEDGPERWSVESRAGGVAHLDIPAHASRDRRFEIFCSFEVRHGGSDDARHGLRVLVDGAHEWSREVPTHPGPHDSLDLRFRRSVAVGRALRVTAVGEVHGAVPLRLSISAEEDAPHEP
jgi:hypothetical protein